MSSTTEPHLSLVDRQTFLFRNVGSKFKSDVQFHFKHDAVTLYALKSQLSCASRVFDTMFYGSMAAKENEIIDIDDISSDVFRELLHFIYTDEILIFAYNVFEIAYAAHKYDIVSLQQKCLKYLKVLSPTFAIKCYKQIHMWESINIDFCDNVVDYIDRKMRELCTVDILFDLDPEEFVCLTSRDTINVDEFQLYHIALQWSVRACENQSIQPTACNRKKIFQGFKSIRFPIMKPFQFDRCASSILALDIMSLEDMQLIRDYIFHKRSNDGLSEVGFSFDLRNPRFSLFDSDVDLSDFNSKQYNNTFDLDRRSD